MSVSIHSLDMKGPTLTVRPDSEAAGIRQLADVRAVAVSRKAGFFEKKLAERLRP